MHNLELYNPFTFYRLTGSELIFYEDNKKLKKHQMVAVLSPSIEDEFKFFKETSDLKFRHLDKYIIDEFQIYQTYPNKRHKDTITETMIRDIYNQVPSHNDNISNLEIYVKKSRGKQDPLKDFNTIYEVNYIINKLYNDPNDKSIVRNICDKVMHQLNKTLTKANNITGDYHKTLIIPVNQWLGYKSYKNNETFLKTTKNMISFLYNYLLDPKNVDVFGDWKVILMNYNEFMILDTAKYKKHLRDNNFKISKGDIYLPNLAEYLKEFLKSCKSKSEGDKEASLEDVDGRTRENIDDIKKVAIVKNTTEAIIAKSGVDLDDVEPEDREKIEKVLQKAEDNGIATGEIEKLDNAKTAEEITDIITSSLSKKSRESLARDRMLMEKYKTKGLVRASGETLKFGDLPKVMEPVPIEPKKIEIITLNEDLKNLVSENFHKTYNEKLLKYHLTAILNHFTTCNPAMIPITDIEEEDASDELNRVYRYTITYEDTNRKRHKLKFLLPKFYQDKYLYLNGSIKYLNHQKIPFPITKIKQDTVQLGSNYNKIFVYRDGVKVSPKIIKLLKFLKDPTTTKVKTTLGDSRKAARYNMTTIEYDEFISTFTYVTIDKLKIYFNLIEAMSLITPYKEDKDKLPADFTYLPIGIEGDKKYYLDNRSNKVIDNKGKDYGQLSDFIITKLENIVGEGEISQISAGKKFNYTKAMVMTETMPVILLCSSLAMGGLVEVMDIANIKYEFYPNKRSVQHDKNNQGIIRFNDGILVYDLYPYENSLLMNGLQIIPTQEYNFLDFVDRETFMDIFDILYNKRNIIEGIENFRQLYMDPITYQVCIQTHLPTDLLKSLLYGNDLLADNNYVSDTSYNASRVRRNELVMVYLYKILSTQYGRYRINPDKVSFTIPEDAIIKELLNAEIQDEYSKLNIQLAIEMDKEIKMKGPFGLNVDQAYTLDKRAYHPSMMGIVASATAPSGEVGIKRHLALNANIVNALGMVQVTNNFKELNGTQLFTAGELLNTFANEKSDATRGTMGINQGKQLLPTERTSPDMLTYGVDAVIPYINNTFSYVAKGPGKVIEISDDIMIVQYKDGTKDDIDLAAEPIKHTNSAKFTTSQKVTDFKVGSSFKEGEVLAYDRNHIKGKNLFGNVVTTTGINANIAFVSTGESYEDSVYIDESFSNEGSSKIGKEKQVTMSRFANIHKIVKVGDIVQAGDPLIIFDDTGDADTAEMSKINREQRDIVDSLSNTNIKTKTSGKITAVRIYYGIDESEISESIMKVARKIQGPEKKRKALLKKHGLVHNSNTLIKPTGPAQMDSRGKIKGIKVEDNILFEFVIETRKTISSGDKITSGSAVKGINSHVIPTALTAYALNEPDFKVQVYVSSIGVYKRMAHDISIMAVGNKCVVGQQKNMKNKYGRAVKNAIGKA